VATQALVDRQIDEGAEFLAAADSAGLNIPVAFWEYRSEWGEWRLVLASPDVDEIGLLAVYRKLLNLPLNHQSRHKVSDRISVVSLRDPRAQALRQSRWMEVDGEGVWLGRTAVGRVFFEDACLYHAR
jgi:hypothetical protein